MCIWSPPSHRRAAVAVLALVLAICSPLGALAQETLVVGLDSDAKPMSWVDEHGELHGFNVDLIRAIGQTSGMRVEFRLGTTEEMQQAHRRGEVDAMFLFYDEERDLYLDYAEPHQILYHVFVVRPGAPPIHSLHDLRGKTVVVQAGALVHRYLLRHNLSAAIVTTSSKREALARLAAGDGDVALVRQTEAQVAIGRPPLKELQITGPPVLPVMYALAVPEGRTALLKRLDAAMAELKASGQFAEIYDHWFALSQRDLAATVLRYVLWVVVPLLLVLGLILLWNWMLRGQVAVRTRDLQLELAERKRAEQRLQYQATHDALTDLANRVLLRDRIDHAIAAAQRRGSLIAVLLVDLDRFKTVNDSLGHSEGDALLRAVAERLRTTMLDGDTVARLGGDEFVLLMEDLEQESKVIEATETVIGHLHRPYRVSGREFFIGASIGIALFPRDGQDCETLLRNADTALYQAKEAGRDTVRFYAPEMNQLVLDRLELEKGLRYALERNELELLYQPQIAIADGQLVGVEALLRWRHPERGEVSPSVFIPVAEETGLVLDIGEWVLRQACAQVVKWEHHGLDNVQVAINLSARQFLQPSLPAILAKVLRETGAPARKLKVEITESSVMADVDAAVAIMGALRRLGVSLAIDDFGTGYASLSYLRRFPVDQLKIDQSFVREVTRNAGDAAIIRAVITLAHSLNLQVVAEGVETAEQEEFLRRNGCDWVQGFFHGPALRPEELVSRFAAAGWGVHRKKG